jgi:transcriptional regulator with XRE-family HTH domain
MTKRAGAAEIGARIRAARKVRKLTVAALAEFVGVSTTHLSRWEAGDCRPDALNIKFLAAGLGVEAKWLESSGGAGGWVLPKLTPARAPGDFVTEAEIAEAISAPLRAAEAAAARAKAEETAAAERAWAERKAKELRDGRMVRRWYRVALCHGCGKMAWLYEARCEVCFPLDSPVQWFDDWFEE